jgi:hypothetical protein
MHEALLCGGGAAMMVEWRVRAWARGGKKTAGHRDAMAGRLFDAARHEWARRTTQIT